jgi:sucrose-6-phosphate hydrolase SacC (GH32 family)
MALYLEGNTYALFASPDLKRWAKLSQIVIPETTECPEFFQISLKDDSKQTRWVFYGGNGHYLVGSFDGKEFKAESSPQLLHRGDSWYASQTYTDIPREDGRRILIPWGTIATPGMPFNQMMGIPVELQLRRAADGFSLCASPVKEVESLRAAEPYTLRDRPLSPGENALAGLKGELLDIDMELSMGQSSTLNFNLRGVPFSYDVTKEELSWKDQKASLKPENGKIRLRFLVDRTSIEVFGNDGLLYLTAAAIVTPDNQAIELSANGGQATIRHLEAYQLKSIWPQ